MPDSDQQKSLYALAGSELESEELREVLYEQFINNLTIDKNYYIILMANNYDIVSYDNDEDFMDKDGSTFNYFICGICPIKEAKAELRYAPNQSEFRETSTGSVMMNPMLGFMYPAYLDGDADIYKALYYTTKESHEELVPINLVSKKYEIRTDDTVITTEPENALMIKTREIDGRKYILIPANGRITVNGQDVFFED